MNKNKNGCDWCPIGTYSSSGSTKCIDCPKGRFSGGGSSYCKTCEEGKIVNKNKNGCDCCPPGTYSSSGSTKCLDCPKGTFSGWCSSTCTMCEQGKIVNKNKNGCDRCPPGTYSSSSSVNCIRCPPGTYSFWEFSSCSVCKEGTRSNSDNTGCDTCPPGTYSASKSSECHICPKGTFSDRGYSSCTPCPEGYYADTEGSSQCKKCPDNTYSYLRSSFCFECTKGQNYCSGPIESRSDNPEKDEIENLQLKEFGKLISKILFGVSIKFESDESVFLIPGYLIHVQIYSQIIFDLKGDIKFKIDNKKIQSIEYGNEIGEKIHETISKIEDILKGKINILTYSQLQNKLSNCVTNGEININYDFFDNSIEIDIVSKIQNDKYGTENDVGVKYKIKPMGNEQNYLTQELAIDMIKEEDPIIIGTGGISFDMPFELIKELLNAKRYFELIKIVTFAIIWAVISLCLAKFQVAY